MDIETKWLTVSVKGVDRENRSLEGYASTSMPDYEGEVILPSAWKESLKTWKKMGSRPKFLAYHKHSLDSGHSPVIGTIESMEVTADGLQFHASFAETELGNEHLELYATKAMDAFSVGFIPQERELEPEKMKAILKENGINPKSVPVSRVTTKAHVLEVSAVVVGMNMGALVKSAEPIAVKALERLKADGLGIDPEGKAIENLVVNFGEPTSPESVPPVVEARVDTVEVAINADAKEAKPDEKPIEETKDPDLVVMLGAVRDLMTAFLAHSDATEKTLASLVAKQEEIKATLDDLIESKAGEPAACACAQPAKADAKAKADKIDYLAGIVEAARKVREQTKR